MAELRAGGLALVIKSVNQELVGRVVTLVGLLNPGSFTHKGDRHFFKSNGVGWLCEVEEGIVVFRPGQLMPIDGDDFSHEDERQKENVYG